MKRKLLLSIPMALFLILGMGQPQSQAQSADNLQIGFVNPQNILQRMPEMQAVRQRLQNFAERKQNELAEKEQEFQSQVQEYQQKESVISDAAKEREEERLGELRAELQEMSAELQQEYQERQMELVNPLFEDIENAISEVAAERGFTFVLNTTTSNGDVIVLYASDELQQNNDITDAVLERLEL